jgi:glyceraldehyde 3-phosphate dehydrogenase
MAMNVPVPNGSVVDLVCWHEKPVSRTAINEVLRTAAASRYRGIVEYEENPIVSSDVLCTPYSGTFDSMATMVLSERVSKTLSWYDNGFGYAHRVVDLVHRFARMDGKAA